MAEDYKDPNNYTPSWQRDVNTQTAAPVREKDADPINPTHYKKHPSGVECIAVSEHFNFNLGNAIKYIWRHTEKGAPIDDLKKAAWYLQRELDRIKNTVGVGKLK